MSDLTLYHLTIRHPSFISATAVGSFSGSTSSQELVLAKGSWLEVWAADVDSGKLKQLARVNTFSIIRSLESIKVAGASKHYLGVASDSGVFTILEYLQTGNYGLPRFIDIVSESFSRTGVRRSVPGEYLASDPRGRAVLTAALEKAKLVYVLNRDEGGGITTSSPLESNSPGGVCFDVVGVDVGYENPVFASLETGTDEPYVSFNKQIVYYELDLGLNYVVKRWVRNVPLSAGLILNVPGGSEGPSGVVVASDGVITYHHPDQEPLNLTLPRRQGQADSTPTYVVAGTMHKLKDTFFALIQTQCGDTFKLDLVIEMATESRWGGDYIVKSMGIQYFAYIPPALTLSILKSGFLFASCEAGDHLLYQFNKLGGEGVPTYSTLNTAPPVAFKPCDVDNLTVSDSMPSLSPLTCAKLANLKSDEVPQLYTASGRASFSTLRTLEHGLEITELISSELPAEPLAVFTTKTSQNDQWVKFIILAFSNETLVLLVGETVTEVEDSGFRRDVSTIDVQQVGLSSLIQVHKQGLRHISKDQKITDWTPGPGLSIVASAANNMQILMGLSDNTIVYFEVDSEGMVNEYQTRPKMPDRITALGLGSVPHGKARCVHAVVGLENETLRVVSLDLDNPLETVSLQGVSAVPSDLHVISHKSAQNPVLHVGLRNGVYIICHLNSISGELDSVKKRFIGPTPVKFAEIYPLGTDLQALLVLSTKTWLSVQTVSGHFDVVPLARSRLTTAALFSNEDCPSGVVGAGQKMLDFFTIEEQKDNIRERSISLSLTPRRIAQNTFSARFYVLGQENGLGQMLGQYGYTPDSTGIKTCIEIVEPSKSDKRLAKLELAEQAAGITIMNCRFASRGREYLVVSVAEGLKQDLAAGETSWRSAELHLYEYTGSPLGSDLQLVHRTQVDMPVYALAGFKGMLLAGVGNKLVLFDVGKKQLLRQSITELSHATTIRALVAMRQRVVVGDAKRSLTYCVYQPDGNIFIPFADDPIPAPVVSLISLDYDTCALGDKFGNFVVLRCPAAASKLSEDEDQVALLSARPPSLNSCPFKLERIGNFYLQDTATSFNKGSLVAGGVEALIYTGVGGTIGAMVPVTSRHDLKFLERLQHEIQTHQSKGLLKRVHLGFRGYYAPPMRVIDGDLCEQYSVLDSSTQRDIAETLERSTNEIETKLGELRLRSVF